MACHLVGAKQLSEPMLEQFIWPLGTNFSEMLIEIHTFSLKENAFENAVFEMAANLSRPQCVNGINSKCIVSLESHLGKNMKPFFGLF